MEKLLRYFNPLSSIEREREKRLRQGGLPEHLSALLTKPFPEHGANLNDLEYLVLDFETTGFEPETDDILSVGYLCIKNSKLDMNSAVHTYIQGAEGVKAETAVINHIVPQMLDNGRPLDDVMMQLFQCMKGKILIAHGSTIEKRFIDHYLFTRYKIKPLPLLWIDTLLLEKSLTINKNYQKSGDYRLASVRARHGLPEYSNHGALIDAVATGELFFALISLIFSHSLPRLGSLYHYK
ncbi:3'-5' exonuclease [Photobacterium sp. OFAV2-7]|uniref:3'-5' exonuclease n=1 Tax=Photobacterium sp. OFAV2-7 TaxID=2917748 RepID=UPI001EF56939|nr:3'-5' exonuclease [Photobacterium sp. OFAV2-7]MCG7588656.1 3'-5' exonuclease [Photobacterium sp. OFAV2-7]